MGKMKIDAQFEAIVRETEAGIRAYIAGMGVTLDMVDDIAQEVYLALYKDMDAMPGNIEPIRWLKGIARNLCMNYFRRTKRTQQRQSGAMAELLATADQAPESAEALDLSTHETLAKCLGQLTEKSRRLVSLRYEEGLTAESMAETINITAGAIRIALLRIRENLRDCMSRSLSRETIL
jgi:RNA polymerase sigma-70 factor, ECF subfamily